LSWAEDQGYDGYDIDYIIEYREQQRKQQKEARNMGEKISKSVWAQKTTTYGQNTYTNVLLSDEQWYGLGAEYKTEDGDGISFEFTKNDKGFLNAVKGTVQIFPGKGTKQPKTGGGSGAGGGTAPKKAWSGGGGGRKTEDHVQIAIMAQSAQKAAVDIVVACLNADKLKLPAKKQDQFDAIVGYTDVMTDMFLAKTAGLMMKVKDGLAVTDLINTIPAVVSDSFTADSNAVAKAPAGGSAVGDVGFVDNTPAEVDAAISGFVETADTDFVEA
tara:strand:- start:2162 stop:2977 length:816 start_codon:yes stop_codon:yes gene_type:complete